MPVKKCTLFNEDQILEIRNWIYWLKNTNVEQCTSGKLRIGNSVCALGGYCHMKNPNGWKLVSPEGYPKEYYVSGMYEFISENAYDDPTITTLPNSYIEKLGILEWMGDISYINDECGYSFEDIAKELNHLLVYGMWTKKTRALVELNRDMGS